LAVRGGDLADQRPATPCFAHRPAPPEYDTAVVGESEWSAQFEGVAEPIPPATPSPNRLLPSSLLTAVSYGSCRASEWSWRKGERARPRSGLRSLSFCVCLCLSPSLSLSFSVSLCLAPCEDEDRLPAASSSLPHPAPVTPCAPRPRSFSLSLPPSVSLCFSVCLPAVPSAAPGRAASIWRGLPPCS
jgi:hypothetical protein